MRLSQRRHLNASEDVVYRAEVPQGLVPLGAPGRRHPGLRLGQPAQPTRRQPRRGRAHRRQPPAQGPAGARRRPPYAQRVRPPPAPAACAASNRQGRSTSHTNCSTGGGPRSNAFRCSCSKAACPSTTCLLASAKSASTFSNLAIAAAARLATSPHRPYKRTSSDLIHAPTGFKACALACAAARRLKAAATSCSIACPGHFCAAASSPRAPTSSFSSSSASPPSAAATRPVHRAQQPWMRPRKPSTPPGNVTG